MGDKTKIIEAVITMINVIDDQMITMINVKDMKTVKDMINVKDDHMIIMITVEDVPTIIMTDVMVKIPVIVNMVNVNVVNVADVMNKDRLKGLLITMKTPFGTTVGTHYRCRKRLTKWKNVVDISWMIHVNGILKGLLPRALNVGNPEVQLQTQKN